VLPITSLSLDHLGAASGERVSSGVAELDRMLGGSGFYRGTTVLVSGTAGTGKTSLAASFAAATCEAGERCLYLAFEESASQLTRNMRSIGIDLEPYITENLLRVHATRPALSGLELHLATMHRLVRDFRPKAVIVDPISNLMAGASLLSTTSMLVRLVDFLKSQNVTAYFLSLTSGSGGATLEQTELHVSSLVDTWLLVRDVEVANRRTRALCVLKSRGMAHSGDIRAFTLTDHGVELSAAPTNGGNGGARKRLAGALA
jgi:circadian clock protein KaiC